MQHDQYFKNLILDYLRDALAFFAPGEVGELPPDVQSTALRQEQLSEELSAPFRETDVAVLLEFPDRSRKGFVVLVEEETEPSKFDILRLVEYCIGLVRLFKTRRIVPVVVFVKPGTFEVALTIGTELETFLFFRFAACPLADLPAADYMHSQNIVARLNLPNMAHDRKDHVGVCICAMEGLLELEPDEKRRRKYSRFVTDYARLTQEEKVECKSGVMRSSRRAEMTSLVDDWLEEGRREGRAEERTEAAAKMAGAVLDILAERHIPATEAHRAVILACRDLDQLARWLLKAVTVGSADEFLPEHDLH